MTDPQIKTYGTPRYVDPKLSAARQRIRSECVACDFVWYPQIRDESEIHRLLCKKCEAQK